MKLQLDPLLTVIVNSLQYKKQIWNLTNQMKKQIKKHLNATKSIGEKLKTKGLGFLVSFFYVICKISNINMRTEQHLAQTSCTELTLPSFLKTLPREPWKA